jgi:hypothetical protein
MSTLISTTHFWKTPSPILYNIFWEFKMKRIAVMMKNVMRTRIAINVKKVEVNTNIAMTD